MLARRAYVTLSSAVSCHLVRDADCVISDNRNPTTHNPFHSRRLESGAIESRLRASN